MFWLTLQQLKSKAPKTRKAAIEKLRISGDPAVVEPLALAMSDDDGEVRKSAAEALGEFKDERALGALITSLGDPSSEVREVVVNSLKKIGDARAIQPLAATLRDPSNTVRWRAAQALKTLGWQPETEELGPAYFVALGELERAAQMGAGAIDPLIASLKSGAYQVRVAAVDQLSLIDDPRVVKPLLEALRDSDRLVRTASANALGRAGDARAVEPLKAVLRDTDQNVRVAAAHALSKLGDERAVDDLMRTLRDRHWEVRAAAAEALGKLRDPRAVEPIILLLGDSDREVRQHAAEALGHLGSENALYPLVLLLKDEYSSVRQAAARALRRINAFWESSEAARRALPDLKAALQDRNYSVQFAAAETLKAMGETSSYDFYMAPITDTAHRKRHAATNIFITLLDDPDPCLRQAAAESLGRLGDARSFEGLSKSLGDPIPWVRKASARALETLHWRPTDELQLAQFVVGLEKWDEAVQLGACAIQPLSTAASSGDAAAREPALAALVRIPDPAAAEALEILSHHRNPRVAEAAARVGREANFQMSGEHG